MPIMVTVDHPRITNIKAVTTKWDMVVAGHQCLITTGEAMVAMIEEAMVVAVIHKIEDMGDQ